MTISQHKVFLDEMSDSSNKCVRYHSLREVALESCHNHGVKRFTQETGTIQLCLCPKHKARKVDNKCTDSSTKGLKTHGSIHPSHFY